MTNPGLCGSCQHVARTATKRGSMFFRCRMAEADTTMRKYPPLPVLQCHGYCPVTVSGEAQPRGEQERAGEGRRVD
jgi:hypothetical protein